MELKSSIELLSIVTKIVVIFEKTFVKEDQAKQFLKKARDESL